MHERRKEAEEIYFILKEKREKQWMGPKY